MIVVAITVTTSAAANATAAAVATAAAANATAAITNANHDAAFFPAIFAYPDHVTCCKRNWRKGEKGEKERRRQGRNKQGGGIDREGNGE